MKGGAVLLLYTRCFIQIILAAETGFEPATSSQHLKSDHAVSDEFPLHHSAIKCNRD